MSEQLTAPPSGSTRAGAWRAIALPIIRQVLIVLILFAVAGAVGGLLWEWLWAPPTGVVVNHQWLQDEGGLRDDFSGTGTYVAVAAIAGLLIGAAVAVFFDRAELVTLLVVAGGSVLAAWVMYHVGLWVSPPDPGPLAESAKNGTHLPGRLLVSGDSPFVAFPGGALVGLVVVFFGLSRRRKSQD